MTTIHFVCSGKANVGKTAFTEILTAIAHQSKHRPHLVDADVHRHTLSSTVKVDKKVAMSDDPVLQSQPDRIWELAVKKDGDVIVDLAGQSDTILNSWIESRGVELAAKEEKIRMIKWWLCDSDPESFNELLRSVQTFPTIQHVLVRSLYRAPKLLWESLEEHSAVKEAITLGVPICSFHKIHVGLIDRLREQKIAIATASDDKSLGALDRSTIAKSIERMKAEIEDIYTFKKMRKPKVTSTAPEQESVQETSKELQNA